MSAGNINQSFLETLVRNSKTHPDPTRHLNLEQAAKLDKLSDHGNDRRERTILVLLAGDTVSVQLPNNIAELETNQDPKQYLEGIFNQSIINSPKTKPGDGPTKSLVNQTRRNLVDLGDDSPEQAKALIKYLQDGTIPEVEPVKPALPRDPD